MFKFFSLITLITLFSSCAQSDEEAAKKLKKAEQQTDEIMEMMDLPEYGVKKLIKRGEINTKDFMNASKDLIRHGRRMKDVDHPDEKFNNFSKEMISAMGHFEKALASKDEAKIKSSWMKVHDTCEKCHDVYE